MPSYSNIDGLDKKQLFKEIEKLFIEAGLYLKNNEDSKVCDIFNFLFDKDAILKQKIADALTPKNENELLDEAELTRLIEIQGIYSFFRLSLINEIVLKLVTLYDQAMNFLSIDFNQGAKYSFIARKAVQYYDMRVEKLNHMHNSPYRREMFIEIKEVYAEVNRFGESHLKRLTDQILSRENELSKKIR
jgi:hypothetical protein